MGRQKRPADAEMSEEEQQLMQLMPTVCGMQLVQKLTVGTEGRAARVSNPSQARPRKITLKAKISCAGCNGGWTPLERVSNKLPTKEVKQQRATPKSQTWVIPSSEENLILEACCN